MTKEEKQLVLVDLCGRLPYGIKVLYREEVCTIACYSPSDGEVLLHGEPGTIFPDIEDKLFISIEDVKFYLRPMESMTEEEREEVVDKYLWEVMGRDPHWYTIVRETKAHEYIDWLNAHHFDYRGLIPMNLALPAPEEMYKKGE